MSYNMKKTFSFILLRVRYVVSIYEEELIQPALVKLPVEFHVLKVCYEKMEGRIMTYEELVAKVKGFYQDADAKAVAEHVAVQFNIGGEAEGAYYVEVADGKVAVEPYEYFDRDAIAYTSASVVTEITENKISFADAVSNGSIHVEGNVLKALLLSEVKVAAKKAVAEKTTEKKETVKAEPAKKPDAKKTASATAKTVKAETVKAEPAKAETVKTESVKTATVKAEPAKKTAATTAKKTK